ncbi:ADP-ribosylation factor-like protein 6-interacting protein 6 [Anabas testudineus]|uniref:ADP-ribosylation factor-like protein 6-interacting protein 6 n=1 Tax=Anabas testudineus TaxID=64144 RepID=A0A3Q1IFX5_ANATE|nr:ADP-ribosylation factor-like protein 6-interacting protein 6 [Anabas testudineus]
MDQPQSESVRPSEGVQFGQGSVGGVGRSSTNRKGLKPWSAVVLSVLLSAVAALVVGCFCALTYPIIRELRSQRVRGENGAEEKMLSFWSITVLSVLVGCICSIFSWTLTYFDSYQPGMVFPTQLVTAPFRDGSGSGFHMGYGVAVLNGIMAMLTVIWSLS